MKTYVWMRCAAVLAGLLAGAVSVAADGRAGNRSASASATGGVRAVGEPTGARNTGGTYWGDRERGWFWYEDPLLEQPEETVESKPATRADESQAPELVEMEQLQKDLDKFRKIAIIRPTEDNIRRYMELEARIVAMASRFADMTQRVAWANPALDPSWQNRPANKAALDVYDQQTRSDRAHRIAELSETHVLFFFFRSDCPYCHAYAPILARFEKDYGLRIVPVSLDGGGLPEYQNPRKDNGIATNLNVTSVPATFLAAPFEGTIVAIGAGVLNETQLLERITVAMSPRMLRDVPGATRQLSVQ